MTFLGGEKKNFPRPVLVVSKCLELDACRYNGQIIRAPFILQIQPHVDLRPICPEVEIGLGTPRDPIRLVRLGEGMTLVQPTTGRDVTQAMEEFSERFLSSVREADGFLLKGRSPSCGIKDTKIYGGPEGNQPSGKGAGMFGGAVLARFPHAAVEDEGRLTNYRLRHHFLVKLYMRAAFRAVKAARSMAELVRYHTEHKFQLLACHQAASRALGRVVANAEQRAWGHVIAAYETELTRALERPARDRSNINMLMHAMGFVSDGLSRKERDHFLGLLEEFRANRITMSAPLAVLQSWVLRFEQSYLAQQTFLEPYPLDLMDLRDSGRT